MSPLRWASVISIAVTWLLVMTLGPRFMAMAPVPRMVLGSSIFVVIATLTVLGHFYGPPDSKR